MNSEINNKDEYRIFGYVYDFPESEVTKSEKPDFIVKKNSDYEFGVEITQMYYSESFARLDKIPQYFDEIIDGKPYRDKNDIQNISRKELKIINPMTDENWITHGIEIPQLDVGLYSQKLKKVISNKNDLFSGYQNLPFINLIVSDETMLLRNMKLHLFYSMVIKKKLKRIIQESPYSEIFLITNINEQFFCYPLKLLTFYSFTQHLLQLVIKEEHGFKGLNLMDFSHLVAECFQYNGFNSISIREDDNQCELLWGKSGLRITTRGFEIVDYNYSDVGRSEKFISGGFLTNEIQSLLDNRINQFTVHTNLGFEIKK